MAIDFNGMSIEDIRRLNTRGMSLSELRKATSRLVSAANKRVNRLMKDPSWTYSIAGQNIAARGKEKPFSTKGLKTRGEVKAEFEKVRAFLDPSKKSHTVKGWKKIKEKFKAKGITEEEMRSPGFWSLFRAFYAEYVPSHYDSETYFGLIAYCSGRGYGYKETKDYLDGVYEETQFDEDGETDYFEEDEGDASEFFD